MSETLKKIDLMEENIRLYKQLAEAMKEKVLYVKLSEYHEVTKQLADLKAQLDEVREDSRRMRTGLEHLVVLTSGQCLLKSLNDSLRKLLEEPK
jgi:hypothetical protein